MNIVSIEPTPSPNTMMLHLDERLEDGIRKTYTLDNERSAPAFIRQMLHIPGVKSVFHTTDFVALDRKGNADWSVILGEVQNRLGQQGIDLDWIESEDGSGEHFGEAQVFVQFFRGVPMQIRVKAGVKEERISLSDRFVKAVTEVASATMIKERKLSDYGVRYGELPDIAREVEQELEAAYPRNDSSRLSNRPLNMVPNPKSSSSAAVNWMEPNWKRLCETRIGMFAMRHLTAWSLRQKDCLS